MKTQTLLLAVLWLGSTAILSAAPFIWGDNSDGQIGDGTVVERHNATAVVTTGALSGKTITTMAGGIIGKHTLAVSTDGKLYAWGDNRYGQLGDGSVIDRHEPVAVDMTGALSGKTVVAVAAGEDFSIALTSDGLVFSWGRNDQGQLGDGSTGGESHAPVAVDTTGVLSGKIVTAIDAGGSFAAVLTSAGQVFTWGDNLGKSLGNGGSLDSDVPVAVDMSGVLSGKTVTSMSTGWLHTQVIASDGLLYAWGLNDEGQIGDGSKTDRSTPVAVDTSGVLAGKTLVAVSCGLGHSVALSDDGMLFSWGINGGPNGILGDGTTTTYATSGRPVTTDMTGALSGKTITALAAGTSHTLVLTSDGEVFGWGYNGNGQIGDGTIMPRPMPTALNMSGALAGQAVTVIFGGSDWSLALASPVSTTISSANRYTYAANFSWLNWRWSASSSDAPVIETTMLHGKVYAANVGWIDLGDGSPSTSAGYSQTGGDIGVNHDGAGGLSGYAYGANIGWIYFDPTIAQPPRIDLVTGAFSGYAYSANCGWIFLGTIKTSIDPGPDTEPLAGGGSGDGIADSWEIEQATAAGYGSSLSLLGTNANSDFDHDGISDRDEYLADTNPFSVNDRLDITGFTVDPLTGNIDLDWNGSTRRLFRIHYSSNLSTWSPLGDVQTGGSAALTATLPLSNLFFKVEASLPLPGP